MEAKVRISYGTREFEAEGSEAFVLSQLGNLATLMEILASGDSISDDDGNVEQAAGDTTEAPSNTGSSSSLPDSFGEYLNQFKKGLNQDDQMLVAGYFVQCNSSDNAYSTKEANELLKEQGVKVGNPSQAVSVSKVSKKVFALQKGRFRVSRPGVDHINSLQDG